MLSSIVRILRLCGALFAAALLLQILMLPAGAGERADFDAAVKQATVQYRVALKTLREVTSPLALLAPPPPP